MKPLPPEQPVFRRAARKGVALILVLSALVLITALVIGLMARAVTERKSATSYVAVASTRQLADTVVNTIQAQINDATTQGSSFSWASQPGAIRVFSSSGTGNLQRIYKLYSANTITATSVGDLATDVPPSDWADKGALWTDLNAPATYTVSGSTTTQTAYPILDVRFSGTETPHGFTATPPSGWASFATAVPMPVRWLYVLQDGRLVSPDATTTTTATFASSAPAPTATNPIVGRVAFWTDDESCKVNINTAGEGIFWDTPHFEAPDERKRAGNQPASKEFQGYPGHPATTSLKSVFRTLTTEQILSLLPRYDWGGSRDGEYPATAAITPKTGGALRLYSSPGELLLNYQRTSNGLTRQQLESAKFFITARSRAPEVNLFGKPRVAIWPIHSNTTNAFRTITDRLIAFCSTINADPYYFQRFNSNSTTDDITIPRNTALLNYLDSLTQETIPCINDSFQAKYGAERRQILTEMFDYTRITNLRDPQLASTSTYVGERNTAEFGWGQVTPSRRLDWSTRGFGRFPVISEASIQFICMGEGDAANPADKQVNLAQYNMTKENIPGGTPVVTVAEIPQRTVGKRTVQAFFLLNFFVPAMGLTGMELGATVEINGLNALSVKGSGETTALDLKMTSSGALTMITRDSATFWHGRNYSGCWDFRSWTSRVEYPQRWSYQRKLKQGDPQKEFAFYSDLVEIDSSTGQMILSGGPLVIRIYSGNTIAPANLVQTYTMNFPADTNGGITSWVMPIPTFGPHPRNFGTGEATNGHWTTWLERTSLFWMSETGQNHSAPFNWWHQVNKDHDVLWSVVPSNAWGDYRLLALADNVPASAFVVHPNAGASSRLAYGTKDPRTHNWWHDVAGARSVSGNFITGIKTNNTWDNIVPATVNGAFSAGNNAVVGDWDNGFAAENAAPYINKPDEGILFGSPPYFDGDWEDSNFGMRVSHFSPNRQLPSAVMFGSLPTGGRIGQSWQTLLFRPGPLGHKGEASPKDHFFLDLFWMPVAEPYAISEPFSTAGKVNMNYEIRPFTYIKRSTAVQAVLMNEKIAKVHRDGPGVNNPARVGINLDYVNGTLRQFDAKFAANDIFRSASEICDIFLVPTGQAWTSDSQARSSWYGDDFARVGDNVRERPYAHIYPRLTTKSNVYTVHYIVQALKNPNTANQGQFDQSTGLVIGEYRGSTTLERYIDSNDTSIPDYAESATEYAKPNLENFYRWRIIENAQFAP